MSLAFPALRSDGALFSRARGRRLMDVILHLGAHRTATTSFQHYLRGQGPWLAARGIGYWGPLRTRRSVLPGLFPGRGAGWRGDARRAEGRVRMLTARAEARGLSQLLVSDENMLGSCQQCLRTGQLYPAAGERLARLGAAFGGRLARVVLTLRSPDHWWASAAALAVARGHAVPGVAARARIARGARSWRGVIEDLACALPQVEIRVRPFERAPGRPELLLACLTGAQAAPAPARPIWRNRAPELGRLRALTLEAGGDPAALGPGPDGARYQPFTAAQGAALRAAYAEDLCWLDAGAGGLATLTEETPQHRAGPSLPPGQMTEGHDHDQGQGQLALPR